MPLAMLIDRTMASVLLNMETERVSVHSATAVVMVHKLFPVLTTNCVVSIEQRDDGVAKYVSYRLIVRCARGCRIDESFGSLPTEFDSSRCVLSL